MRRSHPPLAALAALAVITLLAVPRVHADSGAVVILVDRSASMNDSGKWSVTTQALVDALDRDSFDGLEIGLVASPNGTVTGPACVFNFPVPCAYPLLPQIVIAPAGPKASVGPGHRRDLRDWLTVTMPVDAANGDGQPLYGAIATAISALQGWAGSGPRVLLVLTDGGIGCAQLSPRPGYADCNGCDHEWENPLTIVQLVADANADASKPVETFVVGLPGSDSYDATACSFPPYHMKLALSAIAAAGAPEQVPTDCDGRTYTQGGGDPSVPCHDDLSGDFSQQALADDVEALTLLVTGANTGVPVLVGGAAGALALAPAHPNPARHATTLRFTLPRGTRTRITVHDLAGRLVRTLADAWLAPGGYSLDWDLHDGAGSPVAGGLYFVQLSSGGASRTGRISVVR